MNTSFDVFFRDAQALQGRFENSRSLMELERDLDAFARKYGAYMGVADYLLHIAEGYYEKGDNAAGVAFVKAVDGHFAQVNNKTVLRLRMAQYYFENGDEASGIRSLVTLCSEISNYEESIEFTGLMPLWERYRHLVEGKVPPSVSVMSCNPLPPEKCSVQIGEILALPEEDLLSSLSTHLAELSGNGEYLNYLNQWERTVFYADELCMEVNSGGFGAYLYGNGQHFEKACQSLETVGAGEALALLERIREKFPRKKVPKTVGRLQETLDTMEENGTDFEEEDEAYYSCAEKELLKKLHAFVWTNRAHFR